MHTEACYISRQCTVSQSGPPICRVCLSDAVSFGKEFKLQGAKIRYSRSIRAPENNPTLHENTWRSLTISKAGFWCATKQGVRSLDACFSQAEAFAVTLQAKEDIVFMGKNNACSEIPEAVHMSIPHRAKVGRCTALERQKDVVMQPPMPCDAEWISRDMRPSADTPASRELAHARATTTS